MFSFCAVSETGVAPVLSVDFVKRFLANPRFARTTVASYAAALKVFFRWCSGSGVVSPVEGDIAAYRAFLLDRYRLTTAQCYLAVVKLFFAWLAKHGLYEDVAADVRGVQVNRSVPLRDFLSGRDMQKVLGGLRKRADAGDRGSLRDYVMVQLMVCCGLRVSEVCRLDVGDIVFSAGVHQVQVHGKGRDGKSDRVNVPDGIVDEIHSWLAARGSISKDSPLFVSLGRRNHGGRMCARTVSQIVKQALRNAGFDSPRLTAHSLRHTAVTLALMGGATLQEAQQYARHSRIETTQIYAHNLEASKNRCSRLVEKMVLGVMVRERKNPYAFPQKRRER